MPGLAARRNAHNLAPIKTSFNEQPQAKAVPSRDVASTPSDVRMSDPRSLGREHKPVAEPKLKRKKSRTAIFDLFSRPNVEQSYAYNEAIPPIPALPKEHETLSRRPSTQSKRPPRTAVQEEPLSLSSKSSRPQLRSTKSAKSLRSQAKKDGQHARTFKVQWHPPPLFQAYPQAIIHTSLEVPASSKEPMSVGEKNTQLPAADLGQTSVNEATPKGPGLLGRIKSRSRLREDAKSSDHPKSKSPSCARYVYILVTSGYLLQYTGDGPFDRLPEKILKLGPQSAAFASDSIEGKHWVLKVLQTAKVDDFSVKTEQTFLSKLGVQTAYTRRLTSSMLLVFSGAEELDSWRIAIRNAIGHDITKPQPGPSEAPSLSRYSSIVRHKQPAKDADPRSPTLNSSASSPTVVGSQRASSTVVGSASTANFPTRFSRQLSPPQYAGDLRPLSVVSSRSDEAMIGPALKSPGFFERQRTPMTATFPNSTWSGEQLNEPLPFESSPTMLSSSSYLSTSALGRSRSVHSLSSRSSNTGAEADAYDNLSPSLSRRRSDTKLSALADKTSSIPATPLLPLPSPALQNFPDPPRRATTSPKEMDSIAESPPQSIQGEPIGSRPKSSVDTAAEPKRIPYTRASASFTPGAATLVDDAHVSKRKSVFARPIPIATPHSPVSPRSTENSNPASRRTSLRGPPVSTRTATLEAPKSPTSSKSSRNSFQDNNVRRFPIGTDHAPFLTQSHNSTRSSLVSAPTMPSFNEQPQSQRVPITRPPSIRHGSRTRSSAAHLHFPPPRPPPTGPLPAPPSMTG